MPLPPLAGFFLLLICGCPTPEPDTDTDTSETGEPVSAPCSPALSLDPQNQQVLPFELAWFSATGGTGNYRYVIENINEEAEINIITGSYVAGPTPGQVDTIVVTDTQCEGSAQATIEVMHPLQAMPETMTVVPETTFQVVVEGGSGSYSLDVYSNATGSTVDGLSIVAGTVAGNDIFHVTDDITGQIAAVQLTVDPLAEYKIWGGQLIIPLGSSYTPIVQGGSETFTATVLDGDVTIDEGHLVGDIPGLSLVQFDDPYSNLSTKTYVTVVEPAGEPAGVPGGGLSQHGAALGPGDLNGDGYPDAVFGYRELHIDHFQSGGVLVYKGGPDGLEPDPVLILAPDASETLYGYALSVADFNGDGQPDLAVGAPQMNQSSINMGAVFVYNGIEGDFFESEPSAILYGNRSYDRMGEALATCDINNDGLPDLITASRDAEDRSQIDVAYSQGEIQIFYGTTSGISPVATTSLWGQVWSEDQFVGSENMRIGTTLTTGDFNGDSLCDIASGSYYYAEDGEGYDGIAMIFAGTETDGRTIETEPAFTVVFEATRSTYLGRSIAAGDLDGDGTDELIIGALLADTGTKISGGAFIFWPNTKDRWQSTTRFDITTSDWFLFGDDNYDYYSRSLAVSDVDNDGLEDLVIGSNGGEIPGSAYTTGIVQLHTGAQITADVNTTTPYDASTDTPEWIISGLVSNDRLGQATAILGDVDLDGHTDFFSLAGYDNSYGIRTGAPYYIGGIDLQLNRLAMPTRESGSRLGYAVALVDDNGDGNDALWVASPAVSREIQGVEAGHASRHALVEGEFDPTTSQVLKMEEVTDGQRYGWDISSIGDFNGDGWMDLGVAGRRNQISKTSTITDLRSCPYQGKGAAYIYLGSSTGFSATPAFRLHSPNEEQYTEKLAGGFDHNGDGRDDLLLSSRYWNAYNGGFTLAYGQDENTSGLVTLCEGFTLNGSEGGEDLGSAVAPIGDVDGDGCDEFAVSAKDQSFGISSQGVVWVFWGAGGAGCPATTQVTLLGSGVTNADMGFSMAGGKDIDGDAIPDLIVSAKDFSVSSESLGAVWLVPGDYLRSLPRQDISDATGASPNVFPHIPADGLSYALFGTQAGGDFGMAVSLVTSPDDPNRAWVAVGTPYGTTGKDYWSGFASVHEWIPGVGFNNNPKVLVTSESSQNNNHLGFHLGSSPDKPRLAVGSPFSNFYGTAIGAALAFEIQPSVGE